MAPRPREVYITQFPFSDPTSSKVRPVLILSSETHNKHGASIVCAITTNETLDFSVHINEKDLDYGKLYGQSSDVLYSVVFTIDNDLLQKRILRLKSEKFDEIAKRLKELI